LVFTPIFFQSSVSHRDLHSFPTRRSSDLVQNRAVELDFLALDPERDLLAELAGQVTHQTGESVEHLPHRRHARLDDFRLQLARQDRKSTRLNSSHLGISYAVFCLKKKNHI